MLQSMGLQRVRYGSVTEQRQQLIKDIDLQFYYDVFALGTKVILTSENDLESIPSFFVFWKNLEAVGVNSQRVYYLQTERSKMIIKNRFLRTDVQILTPFLYLKKHLVFLEDSMDHSHLVWIDITAIIIKTAFCCLTIMLLISRHRCKW